VGAAAADTRSRDRATDARIASAVLTHTYGRGSVFHSSIRSRRKCGLPLGRALRRVRGAVVPAHAGCPQPKVYVTPFTPVEDADQKVMSR